MDVHCIGLTLRLIGEESLHFYVMKNFLKTLEILTLQETRNSSCWDTCGREKMACAEERKEKRAMILFVLLRVLTFRIYTKYTINA